LDAEQRKANSRTVKKAVVVVIGMFAFGFALIPLYNVICEKLGINGQTEQVSKAVAAKVKPDLQRSITVKFYSHVNSGLNWEFEPAVDQVSVHPGKLTRVEYIATNRTGAETVGRATFRISPPEAARFFKKSECFCFTQQKLKGGQRRRMPLVFYIDPKISKRIDSIILSYSFQNAAQYAKK